MTAGDAILFAFIFVLCGSFSSIFTFISGNLIIEKIRERVEMNGGINDPVKKGGGRGEF